MPETTVMLVGTSGAGKSTLGNFLLYESPIHEGGFSSAAGREPITNRCTSRQDNSQRLSPFKVIDTPGIPDPNGNTKLYFDFIVQEARNARSLNAVVFVMDYCVNRNDVARGVLNASVLLEQFNKLGCTTIIACRVPPHVQGMNEDGIRSAELCWNSFVTEISHAAGLRISATYFLGADMVSQARQIRELITMCPMVHVAGDSGMQTFDELRRCVVNRRNEHRRRVQLEEDANRLKKGTLALRGTASALEAKQTLYGHLNRGAHKVAARLKSLEELPVLAGAVSLALGVAALASVGVVVAIADAGAYSLIHAITLRNISLNRAAIAKNERFLRTLTLELSTTKVDVQRLTHDEDILRKLNELE